MNLKDIASMRRHSDSDEQNLGPVVRKQRGHFRFNTISILVVLISLGLGMVLQGLLAATPDPEAIASITAGVLVAAALLYLLPYWPLVVVVIAAIWAAPPLEFGTEFTYASAFLTLGFLAAPGFEVIYQWDKVVVLRLGKFHRVKGPGVMFLLPLMDSIAGYVDTRIRVTDFSAEKSLTLDTVPVHIDALAFWMVWDPEKAILEVENFADAVVLSAQTALRSSIGSHTLTALLSDRERLGREIQKIVDDKTNPWGITIISVEFKEILVPKDLEDALSREAQAERERNARVILGSTEAEIADTFRKAADTYRNDPTALQLRGMNMIYESIRNKGGLVLTPASALDSMNMGTVLGAAAYGGASGTTPPAVPGDDGEGTSPEGEEEG